MDPKTDIRKTRSRKFLTEALILLLQTKDLEKITVNDIVMQARIARSTFYAQFEDKPHFINSIIEETMVDLRKETLPVKSTSLELEKESHDYYKKHFDYILKNAELFKAMMGEHGTPLFRKKLEESAFITYEHILSGLKDSDLPIPRDYFIQYIISAHIGITEKWLEGGLRYSASYMAELVTQLTFYGLLHGLEIDRAVTLPK